jgi:hypothetical protein
LFCRVIEKREEHQKNVQIHTIPETVPTMKKSIFEFVWEKRFGFGWEKGFELQGYGMEMDKAEGAADEQACSLAGVRMEEWDFGLDGRRILTINVGVKFESPLTSRIAFYNLRFCLNRS